MMEFVNRKDYPIYEMENIMGIMEYHGWLVVVYPYPSAKDESLGMMTFPTEWENKIDVPN